MESAILNPQTSIGELISAYPKVIPVFLRRRMNCVGCSMAGFETLEDAAMIYGLDFDEFFKELINRISIPAIE